MDPRLYALNETLRMHPQVRNRNKKQLEEYIGWKVKEAGLARCTAPVWLDYLWVMPDARRDKSNVAAGGRKIIEDALGPLTKRNPRGMGILRGDGWHDIIGWRDRFAIDREHPRIEVTITEADT
jgi:hypothetical protein